MTYDPRTVEVRRRQEELRSLAAEMAQARRVREDARVVPVRGRDESTGGPSLADQHALTALFRTLERRLHATRRVEPGATANSLRLRDRVVVIADGPFAETKEQILAPIVVDRGDLAVDMAVATQVPSPALAGSR